MAAQARRAEPNEKSVKSVKQWGEDHVEQSADISDEQFDTVDQFVEVEVEVGADSLMGFAVSADDEEQMDVERLSGDPVSEEEFAESIDERAGRQVKPSDMHLDGSHTWERNSMTQSTSILDVAIGNRLPFGTALSRTSTQTSR